MIHAKRTAPALVLSLLLAGCARVWVTPRVITDAFRSAPVGAAEVLVVRFVPLDSIPDACERVAVLRASGQQDLTDEAEMVEELREETGKLGGNVVAILTLEEASRGERVLDVFLGTGVDRDALALSLRCPAGAAQELARRGGGS